MYTIKEVTDRAVWESITGSVLLQTWNWGEFQRKIGNKTLRLGVYKGDVLVGGAQILLVKSHLRTHLYIPNGPVLKDQKAYLLDARKLESILEAVLIHLRHHRQDFFTHYIRVDPLIIDSSDENKSIIAKLGFLKAGTQIQPQHTVTLDLTQSEDALLEDMTKTTRYDIKRGQKEGITIRKSATAEDFDIFWHMYKDTFKRQKFVASPKQYYLEQMKTLSEGNNYYVYIAFDAEKRPIAGALIAYDEMSAYYLHAGRILTNSEAGKYSQKVLLWQIIKDAKARGLSVFNLYGIAKDDSNPNDPWNGLSQFKKSFGGTILHFTGAYDFPLTLNYWFIRILERTRKIWGFPYFVAKQLLNR